MQNSACSPGSMRRVSDRLLRRGTAPPLGGPGGVRARQRRSGERDPVRLANPPWVWCSRTEHHYVTHRPAVSLRTPAQEVVPGGMGKVCGGGGEVVGVDGEDVGGVPVGVVVGQGCCVASGGGVQVVVVGAEVAGGGCGGLVDVLDVAVAPLLPGRGDELQGPAALRGVPEVSVRWPMTRVWDPSSAGPMSGGRAMPFSSREDPCRRPWSVSMRPNAAMNCHWMPQPGAAVAAAFW